MSDIKEFTRRVRDRDEALTQLIFRGEEKRKLNNRLRNRTGGSSRTSSDDNDNNDDNNNSIQLSRRIFQELFQAIALYGRHSQVRKVRISGRVHEFLRSPTHSDVEVNFFRFWDMVGALPAIEELELIKGDGNSSSVYTDFLVRVLLQRIENLSQLKRLKITTETSLPPFHIEHVAAYLRQAMNLEEIYMTRVSFGSLQEESITPVVSSLIERNNLRILDFRGVKFASRPLISKDVVREVFRSRKLKKVALVNMGLNNEHAQIIADELKHNSSIEHIDISGNWFIDEKGYRMFHATMQNQFYVKSFRIGCAPWLRGEWVSGVTIPHEEAASSMTKRIPATIASFAKLNAAGRRDVMHNMMTERVEWIDLLEVVRNDLDAIFYLLQLNPELCGRGRDAPLPPSLRLSRIKEKNSKKKKRRRVS